MRHIEKDGYHLFDWLGRQDFHIDDFWGEYPELVVGKFLVNTSFDSGHLVLTDKEEREGWKMVGQLAHSPRILNGSQIPHDQYDEWLVFDALYEVTEFETMVNYSSFTPVDFAWEEKMNRYWEQILRHRPLHVIGDNGGVYLVTRDTDIASRLLNTGLMGADNAH